MRTSLIGLSAALFAVATPAAAAIDLGNGISVTGGATAVSDYRFRGVSLTDKDPAAQGTLTLSHESGLYAGTWVSNLQDTPAYGDVEVDLYVGYGREIAPGTTFDINSTFFIYADSDNGTDSDYMEVGTSLKHDFGVAAVKVGANWAPSRKATGNEDLIYTYGEVSAPVPTTPFTLRGRFGVQDLGFTSYNEWQIGAETTLGPVSASLSYVDTDISKTDVLAGLYSNAKAGVVLSLGVAF